MAYVLPKAQPTVRKVSESVWVVTVNEPNRKPQEFRCSTEQQARALASMLAGNEPQVRAAKPPQLE